MIDYRLWIARSLVCGAVVTGILAVTALTWAVLQTMGDTGTAASLVGLLYVLLVCWGSNFVALVVLLAGKSLTESASENNARNDGVGQGHDV